ncbi:MAG: LamG-like jellyroll fold domain-containing protein, partial [Candidatus Micrarchaeia archaeon]
NHWVQVAGVIYPSPTNPANSVTIAYVDGVQLSNFSSEELNNLPCSGNLPLSIDVGGGSSFDGSIANVQIYNTALSANDIKALYQEGIGGAPIKIQNLVGWWPLNGNANDYSGNDNNGVANGVTYTNNWYSGYTAP